MSLEDNNGTQYYAKPIGVLSISPDLTSNNGTSYYWISSNDYILWGQPVRYPHPQTNNQTEYYFYTCNVSSDIGLVLSANNGTKYYYQSAFNCIPFEFEVEVQLFNVLQPDGSFVLQPDGQYVFYYNL